MKIFPSAIYLRNTVVIPYYHMRILRSIEVSDKPPPRSRSPRPSAGAARERSWMRRVQIQSLVVLGWFTTGCALLLPQINKLSVRMPKQAVRSHPHLNADRMSDKEDDSSSLLKGNSGGVSSDSTERYSLRKTSLSLTDEEKRERWEAEYAELFEEGGEFELSIDLVEEHREKFKEAERRWAATGNRTKRCSPLDDPGSQLYAWWNDPIDGPMAMLEVRTSALRVKHALMPFLRAGLIGGCVIGPLAFPMRAALICSRARFGLHILWPAIFLCSTAWATLRKVKAGAEVQRANAAHILSAQHLLGASIIWTLSAIHWHAGDVLAALIFGACGRLCLWPGRFERPSNASSEHRCA